METGNFAFISRHEPTSEQIEIAMEAGIVLQHIGDFDGFIVTPEWVAKQGDFVGVIVVHVAAAMQLAGDFVVGCFRNENRAPVGKVPEFFAIGLKQWDFRLKTTKFKVCDKVIYEDCLWTVTSISNMDWGRDYPVKFESKSGASINCTIDGRTIKDKPVDVFLVEIKK